jgi:hypothetical protein
MMPDGGARLASDKPGPSAPGCPAVLIAEHAAEALDAEETDR